jgi:hypothetical protein
MAYEIKTKQTQQSVAEFINTLADEQVRKDSEELVQMLKTASGEEPKIWGGSMIGFGKYSYKSASGCYGEWFVIGFAPRKQKFSIYLMSGMQYNQELLKKLGKYKTGKGCLYIAKLADIDKPVLQQIIEQSVKSNQQFFQNLNSLA